MKRRVSKLAHWEASNSDNGEQIASGSIYEYEYEFANATRDRRPLRIHIDNDAN
jgi:hypothetical protein